MSHPMWVRGLKPSEVVSFRFSVPSHPMWVRGLKRLRGRLAGQRERVAPYVGAWIETLSTTLTGASGYVAPYVGAWIET